MAEDNFGGAGAIKVLTTPRNMAFKRIKNFRAERRAIMKDMEITEEPIELCRILKFENMVASGGEAKHVI